MLMQDLKNIQKQLAQEEQALLTARDQVRAAHQRIEEARGQITAIQAQIQSTQRKIQELESHAQSIEKRVALLRAYMEMAASSPAGEPPPPPAPEPAPQPAAPMTPKPKAQAKPAQPVATPEPTEPAIDESIDAAMMEPDEDDELDDLEFGQPLTAPTVPDAPAATDPGPITFETMDEEYFTHELLPRTSTFEEELILLLAYHRKAIKPKDIANRFKRLDYTPKTSTTEKNIKQQVEGSHFFELAGEGRVALTDEGRTEAQHLLDTLR
jgi:hypothetical protein